MTNKNEVAVTKVWVGQLLQYIRRLSNLLPIIIDWLCKNREIYKVAQIDIFCCVQMAHFYETNFHDAFFQKRLSIKTDFLSSTFFLQ